jgi:3'-5' exoribonuclease
MARVKPALVRLSDLTPGQYADFFALLADKTREVTSAGQPYFRCRFQDARRAVTFMAWADSTWYAPCERDWQPGQFYKLRAIYDEHEQYGPQLTRLYNIRPVNDADRADGFESAQLVEGPRRDPAAMLVELKDLVGAHLADEPLRRLVLGLLDARAEPLQRLPATRDRYYPFPGGLLEHTLSVTASALQLAERYAAYYPELSPPLNRDLVTAGAALHEIGRVLEFGPEAQAPALTVPGRLAGHLILGRDLVRDAARSQGDVHPELVLLLEHVILTHLGLPEWGSPRLPLVPECLIVHHACDLDAKLEVFARCLSRDQAPGPFTERDPFLGRQLLKGRSI